MIYLHKLSTFMVIGKVHLVNSDKKYFSVQNDFDDYTVAEYYDEKDVAVNDVLTVGGIIGDVFIKNDTKNNYFQAKVRYLGFSEKQMKKIMELS